MLSGAAPTTLEVLSEQLRLLEATRAAREPIASEAVFRLVLEVEGALKRLRAALEEERAPRAE